MKKREGECTDWAKILPIGGGGTVVVPGPDHAKLFVVLVCGCAITMKPLNDEKEKTRKEESDEKA